MLSSMHRAKGLSATSTVEVARSKIDLTNNIKLLGVTLDENLNFNDQVKQVCRASLFHTRALHHIRKFLTENMANSIACALVQSRIDYANSLYTGMSSANFNKLQMVQKTLAHVATLTKKRDHIQPTLKRLHWLPIRLRVNYKVAMLTYTIRLSGEPHHLNAMLIDYRSTRTLSSADEHLLVEPRTKLCSADRAFSVAAP